MPPNTNNIIYSFDGIYAYGSGYINEGEDIDRDEDIDEHDAQGGSEYDGYCKLKLYFYMFFI